MARLGTKVSRSEVSSIPKKPFSVRIFWRKRPQTYFRCQTGYMVRNCSGRKLCSILSQKPSRIRFSIKHVFGLNFCTKSHLIYFMGQTDKMARLGAKVSRSEVSSIPKKPFSVWIFWRKRPQTYCRCQTGHMVRSGAKLFWTKTLLNFASKVPSHSFFQKTRLRFEFLY